MHNRQKSNADIRCTRRHHAVANGVISFFRCLSCRNIYDDAYITARRVLVDRQQTDDRPSVSTLRVAGCRQMPDMAIKMESHALLPATDRPIDRGIDGTGRRQLRLRQILLLLLCCRRLPLTNETDDPVKHWDRREGEQRPYRRPESDQQRTLGRINSMPHRRSLQTSSGSSAAAAAAAIVASSARSGDYNIDVDFL